MLIYAIDDEKIQLQELRDAIKEALPAENVKPFRNAFDALKAIHEEGERPELVLGARVPQVLDDVLRRVHNADLDLASHGIPPIEGMHGRSGK